MDKRIKLAVGIIVGVVGFYSGFLAIFDNPYKEKWTDKRIEIERKCKSLEWECGNIENNIGNLEHVQEMIPKRELRLQGLLRQLELSLGFEILGDIQAIEPNATPEERDRIVKSMMDKALTIRTGNKEIDIIQWEIKQLTNYDEKEFEKELNKHKEQLKEAISQKNDVCSSLEEARVKEECGLNLFKYIIR